MTNRAVNWWKTRVLFGGLSDGKRVRAGARVRVLDCIVFDTDNENLC